jgi:hypothetical protein
MRREIDESARYCLGVAEDVRALYNTRKAQWTRTLLYQIAARTRARQTARYQGSVVRRHASLPTHWDGQEKDEEEELLEALHGAVSTRRRGAGAASAGLVGLVPNHRGGGVLYFGWLEGEEMFRRICNGRDEDKERNYDQDSIRAEASRRPSHVTLPQKLLSQFDLPAGSHPSHHFPSSSHPSHQLYPGSSSLSPPRLSLTSPLFADSLHHAQSDFSNFHPPTRRVCPSGQAEAEWRVQRGGRWGREEPLVQHGEVRAAYPDESVGRAGVSGSGSFVFSRLEPARVVVRD